MVEAAHLRHAICERRFHIAATIPKEKTKDVRPLGSMACIPIDVCATNRGDSKAKFRRLRPAGVCFRAGVDTRNPNSGLRSFFA